LYLALDRYPISPTVRGDFQMSERGFVF